MTWPKVTEMFGHGNDSSLLCLAAAEMTYNVMTLNLTLPDRKKSHEAWHSIEAAGVVDEYNRDSTIMVRCHPRFERNVANVGC